MCICFAKNITSDRINVSTAFTEASPMGKLTWNLGRVFGLLWGSKRSHGINWTLSTYILICFQIRSLFFWSCLLVCAERFNLKNPKLLPGSCNTLISWGKEITKVFRTNAQRSGKLFVLIPWRKIQPYSWHVLRTGNWTAPFYFTTFSSCLPPGTYL